MHHNKTSLAFKFLILFEKLCIQYALKTGVVEVVDVYGGSGFHPLF